MAIINGDNNDNTLNGTTVHGEDGIDVLDGGLGADTMRGGKGNDTDIVDLSTDTGKVRALGRALGIPTPASDAVYTVLKLARE